MKKWSIGYLIVLLLIGQNVSAITQFKATESTTGVNEIQEKVVQTETTDGIKSTSSSSAIHASTTEAGEIEKPAEPSSSEDKTKVSQNQPLSAGDTEDDPILVDSELATTTSGKFYTLVTGGSIGTVVTGSKIVTMTGGMITTLSGSIGLVTGGTVNTMNSGGVIETLNGGSITKANANSTIKNFQSGNIAETRPNSKVETMSGGTIPKCNGNIDTLTGDGKITNLHGNVTAMSGGSIRNLSGSVTTMTGGTIQYTVFFSRVSMMTGGVIEAHDSGATIGQLNGGVIHKSYGNISAMADGLVVYYQGSIPAEGNRGNATVLDSPSIEALIKNVDTHVYDGKAPYDFQEQNQWGNLVTFTYNDQEIPPTEAGQSYVVKATIHYNGEIVTSITGGTFAITPKELTCSAVEVADKVYDGKTTATISKVELNSVVPADIGKVQVDLTQSKAVLDQKDIGDHVSGNIEVKNLVLMGDRAHNYRLADNQKLPITIEVKPFQIDSRSITFIEQSKPYDGKTQSNLAGYFKDEVIQTNDLNVPDDLSLEINNAEYPDARIGSNKQISYNWGLLGKDSKNYTLQECPQVIGEISSPIVTEEIVEKMIEKLHKQTPQKEYDGTINDQFTLDVSELFASDPIEDIELIVHGEYGSKDAGAHDFTITSWEVKNGKAVIEEFPPAPIVLSGKIKPRPITLDWTADTKKYDGTVKATVHGNAVGLVSGDSVNVSGDGSFADKNVGTNKTVKIRNILVVGKDAGNYSYPSAGKASAAITPKELQTVWSSKEKIYDGQREVEVFAELSGLLTDDKVKVTGKGLFADDQAGENKAIAIEAMAEGKDSKNYLIESKAQTTGAIRPKALTIIGVKAVDRLLSESLLVDLDGSQAKLIGVISKDQEKLGFILNSGAIQTVDVGQKKPVQTAIELTGEAAGNYHLTQPELTVTILQKGSTIKKPTQQTNKTSKQLGNVQSTTKKSYPSKLLKANDISNPIIMWTGIGIISLTGLFAWVKRKLRK